MRFLRGYLLCALFIILTACSKPALQPYKHRLRTCIHREPQNLDPRMSGDTVSTPLHFLLFEGLTRFNSDWTISLSVADSVEISKDRKMYLFHLRNSRWSDGSPVTAQDFEHAWKKVLDPEFPSLNAHLFFSIKNAEAAKKGLVPLNEVGIKALDDCTLQVELIRPTPYFLDLTSFAAFFPVPHKKDVQDPAWSRKTGENFVCNGPFHLSRWDRNLFIEFDRNPYYWDQGKIDLEKILFHIIVDGMTALHMYECNELDLIQFSLSPLPPEPLRELLRKGQLHCFPSATSQIVVFNTQQFPFDNTKMRKAFGLAINRSAIVDNILQMGEIPAFSAIPPILKKGQEVQLLDKDSIEEAKTCFTQALQELGLEWWQFPPITFYYSSSDMNRRVAEAIQHQWKEVLSVDVSLQALEHTTLLDRLTKRRFQVGQTIWMAQYNDQMNIFERFKFKGNLKNYSGWENEQFIQLLDRSSSEIGTPRIATLLEAERIFLDEMPVSPLFHLNASFLKKPHVKNLDSPYSSDLCYARITYEEDPKKH
ncbi:MAG: peptide ABC transporter substrate-binding protein [Simkania sp.]|nr:peptide ABC transporter substrate-binding protein [Simkania sp.]